VITEMTKNIEGFRGWVFYDWECSVCQRFVKRFGALLKRNGFYTCPLQEEWVTPTTGLPREEMMLEMKLVLKNGEIFGGADAFFRMMRDIWWTRPAWWISRLPGMTGVSRAAYSWFARNRYCMGGSCSLKGR